MIVSGQDVVSRVDNFEAIAGAVSLRPWQWQLALALDGHSALGTIAATCNVDLKAAAVAVEELHRHDLVTLQEMSLADYRSSRGDDPSRDMTVTSSPISASAHVATPPPTITAAPAASAASGAAASSSSVVASTVVTPNALQSETVVAEAITDPQPAGEPPSTAVAAQQVEPSVSREFAEAANEPISAATAQPAPPGDLGSAPPFHVAAARTSTPQSATASPSEEASPAASSATANGRSAGAAADEQPAPPDTANRPSAAIDQENAPAATVPAAQPSPAAPVTAGAAPTALADRLAQLRAKAARMVAEQKSTEAAAPAPRLASVPVSAPASNGDSGPKGVGRIAFSLASEPAPKPAPTSQSVDFVMKSDATEPNSD